MISKISLCFGFLENVISERFTWHLRAEVNAMLTSVSSLETYLGHLLVVIDEALAVPGYTLAVSVRRVVFLVDLYMELHI